jgi:hypothetical protein
MAPLAGTVIRNRPHEVVRRVAARAIDPRVERAVLMRRLMARATRQRSRMRLSRGRVWIVATHARTGHALLWVIGVLVGVTARAGTLGTAFDVVRLVAARALLVCADTGTTERQLALVTAAAVGRLFLPELVRTVTTDTLAVSTREQRRLGDDGLVAGVTAHARAERLGSSRVLFLVTRGADLIGRFVRHRVRRGDVLVAASASRRLGRCVLVRSMTAEARLARVHLDPRRAALWAQVTMIAISGLVGVRAQQSAAGLCLVDAAGRRVGEAVTEGAVADPVVVQLLARLDASVLDATLRSVTDRAPLAVHGPHLVITDAMTAAARHSMLDHVDVMACHFA